MRPMASISVILACLIAAAADEAPQFATAKAKDAWKAYEKAAEKARADFEARMKKARDDCTKALEAALKDAKKAKKEPEVKAIEETIKRLKEEGGAAGKQAGSGKEARGGKTEKGPGGITFAGGSGDSIEDAVIVQGAKGEPDGVDAEYFWLKKHYPTARREGQGVLTQGGRHYDRLDLTLPDGTKKSVYFDITAFFGKME